MARTARLWVIPTSLTILVIITLVLTGSSAAFGNTYIRTYDVTTGTNASPADSTYGPYYGAIYADNYPNNPGGQILDADNWSIMWGQAQVLQLQSNRTHVGPTFHVFSGANGNCEAPFNSDNYVYIDLPGAYAQAKTADCTWNGAGDYYNEVRIKTATSNIVADTRYEGGAEFVEADGAIYNSTGHVSNDIYTYYPEGYPSEKDHLPTWCFQSNGSAYHC